jgi:hypothetical protein
VRRLRGWERVIARNTYEEPDYALQATPIRFEVVQAVLGKELKPE